MRTLMRNDLKLEYQEYGSGEPVVLVHGGVIGAYYWKPLIDEMLKASNRRVVTYNRRGFGASSPGSEPVTIAEEAEDLRHLITSLGLNRVHLAGHSYGGIISLTMTMRHPDLVHTLTLMEPALVFVIPSAATFVSKLVETFRIGRTEGAGAGIDFFLRSVSGPDYRNFIPDGWWEQALTDAASGRIEGSDFPQWNPNAAQRANVTMPVLSVLGGESHTVGPWFDEGHALVRTWFPQAEEFVLPSATHPLHMMNPHDMATALNGFFARYPGAA